ERKEVRIWRTIVSCDCEMREAVSSTNNESPVLSPLPQFWAPCESKTRFEVSLVDRNQVPGISSTPRKCKGRHTGCGRNEAWDRICRGDAKPISTARYLTTLSVSQRNSLDLVESEYTLKIILLSARKLQ